MRGAKVITGGCSSNRSHNVTTMVCQAPHVDPHRNLGLGKADAESIGSPIFPRNKKIRIGRLH